ncbi:MAG: methyltransferase domain-containing protein [Candidatus Caldatribacterium sp.]|nr:methyltransferase domain-containing protein [Candidatus Caldatribacterium sp.]
MWDMVKGEIQKWDEYYKLLPLVEEDDALKEFHKEFVQAITSLLAPGATILEAGCGAGWQSLALARTGLYHVTLLDASQEALEYARQLFEKEGLIACFVHGDVFESGKPEYDLVFNAGVLEHYNFDYQVQFLKGMASRAKKYVLVLVPNLRCYWYWLWRIQNAGEGLWPFGKEVPLYDLADVFQAAGLSVVGRKFFGASWTEAFINGLRGLDPDVRRLVLEVHRSGIVPLDQRCYLVACLGVVGNEKLVISGWERSSVGESKEVGAAYAALADALALRVGAERRIVELERKVAELEGALEALQAEIQRKAAEVDRAQSRILELETRRYRMADRIVGYLWRLQKNAAPRFTLGLVRILLRRIFRLLPSPVQTKVLKVWYKLVSFFRNLPLEDLQGYRRELRVILKASAITRGVIIYPPTIDWNFMFQRPQQLARALARQGFLFFYCTPNSRVDQVRGFQKVESNLYVCHVPWQVFSEVESPVLFVSWAVHHDLVNSLKNPVVIYDFVDDLEVGGVAEADHETMLRRADLVLAASRKLYDVVRPKRADVILCPNAVDYESFSRARDRSRAVPPPDLRHVLAGHELVVGYHGALARWVDYGLLMEVARRLPEVLFILIGCDYDGTLSKSGILDLGNVFWLGMKPYEELPEYLRWFDVGIIPFKLNKITEACSPIKLWEYLAAGKPVVSTDLPMCREVEGVLIARTPEEFASKILEAVALAGSEDFRHCTGEIAQRETWDARADLIASALERILAAKAVGR